ncbi:hypothetical protein M3Y99_00358900 [Aphelenchoides fujianensis]|nr:hypothetical protein M3Y99_00358900 [Aphelenchoides fujianensis]
MKTIPLARLFSLLLLVVAIGVVVAEVSENFERKDRDYRPLQFGKRGDFRPLQFGKRDNFRPLQFGKRASLLQS